MSYPFGSDIDYGRDFDRAIEEGMARDLDAYDRRHLFDFAGDYYPEYEVAEHPKFARIAKYNYLHDQACFHRPVVRDDGGDEKTETCYICNPEYVAWEVEDYYNELGEAFGPAWLDSDWESEVEIPSYALYDLYEDDESEEEVDPEVELLEFKMFMLGMDGRIASKQSARGARRQWYRAGRKQRRRQDHGTANNSDKRHSQNERLNRGAAQREAIEISESLNRITAEFELNHMPTDAADEDFVRAWKRQETRQRYTKVTVRPHASYDWGMYDESDWDH